MKSSLHQHWQRIKSLHDEVEKLVADREGSYRNISHEALYTSLDDLTNIFASPSVTGTFVDLGCGAGQTALLYGQLHPERCAIGIEFEAARLNIGRELKSRFASGQCRVHSR